MTTNTTNHTPERIHDERLCELLLAESKAADKLEGRVQSMRHATETQEMRRSYGRIDRRTTAEVVAEVEALAAADDRFSGGYCSYKPSVFLADYTAALADSICAQSARATHDMSYTGWQRFFLVTSSAGLVHRDMNCPTCNKGRQATTFALLPSLSGQTINDLVSALGPVLCSVCWPSAPTEWTDTNRIPTSIAVTLFEEGAEAFNAALAAYRAKAAGKAAKVLADVQARGEATYSGADYKLAEALVEAGQATLVSRGGHSHHYSGRWVKTITIQAVAQ